MLLRNDSVKEREETGGRTVYLIALREEFVAYLRE